MSLRKRSALKQSIGIELFPASSFLHNELEAASNLLLQCSLSVLSRPQRAMKLECRTKNLYKSRINPANPTNEKFDDKSLESASSADEEEKFVVSPAVKRGSSCSRVVLEMPAVIVVLVHSTRKSYTLLTITHSKESIIRLSLNAMDAAQIRGNMYVPFSTDLG